MVLKLFSAYYNGHVYRIHKTIGFLLEYDYYNTVKIELPKTIHDCFQQLENPYLLKPCYNINRNELFSKNPFYTQFLAKIYTVLCLKSFLFVRLLSYFRFPIFDSTEQAILFYRRLYPKEQQNLCLPRSLFAACTSKTFKQNGALFIGVFLPSRSMHAWIIEDSKQPDPYDDIWICYQPVAVIY